MFNDRMTNARLPALLLGVMLVVGSLSLTGLSAKADADQRAATGFTFSSPDEGRIQRKLKVAVTRYWLHFARDDGGGGIALKSRNGTLLGPVIAAQDFCLGAHEGTIVVQRGPAPGTYNIRDFSGARQVDCTAYFTSELSARPAFKAVVRKTERATFTRTHAPYGLGVRDMWLYPYRSIAVDPRIIPIGTLVFLPAVRSRSLPLPDGRRIIHDGYFLAADEGTDIRGRHIDIFQGIKQTTRRDTLDDLQDTRQVVWVMDAPEIRQALLRLHRLAQ